MKPPPALSVFFDGDCPLCRREIAWYRKQRGGDSIVWVDVSKIGDKNVIAGLCTEDAMKRLHVQLENGTIISGAQAFAAVWKQLTLFKPLGYIVDLPVIRYTAELAYKAFLKIRPRLQRFIQRNQ